MLVPRAQPIGGMGTAGVQLPSSSRNEQTRISAASAPGIAAKTSPDVDWKALASGATSEPAEMYAGPEQSLVGNEREV